MLLTCHGKLDKSVILSFDLLQHNIAETSNLIVTKLSFQTKTGNMDAKCYVCKSKNPRICFPSDNTMLRRMTAILLIKLRNFSMEMNVQNLHPTHPSQFQVMMSTSLALSSEPLKSTVGFGLCPSLSLRT